MPHWKAPQPGEHGQHKLDSIGYWEYIYGNRVGGDEVGLGGNRRSRIKFDQNIVHEILKELKPLYF